MNETTIKQYLLELDRTLLVAILLLTAVGIAFVYSASMVGEPGLLEAYRELGPLGFLRWLFGRLFFRQLIWFGVGVAAAGLVCAVDYRVLTRWAAPAYWIMILLLCLVLIPGVGAYRFGARRWIDLGPIQFQPSEFAKLLMIFALADYLACPKDELQQPWKFWRAIGLIVLPCVLVVLEPDLGSAVVMIPTGLAMLYVAGLPKRLLLKLTGGVTIIAALFTIDVLFAPPGWQIKLQDYQRRRLLVYFGLPYKPPPGASPAEVQRLHRQQLDDSYNVRQALISIGSGGLTGKGWRNGIQTALGYLPRTVAHNDFIFSVLAEETGFVGSAAVVVLYSILIFSGLRIADQAGDRLGRLLAVGMVSLLFSHVFVNIGMNIRLLPVTGVPLPFMSYGGTSLVCSLIAAGILQNVHLRRKGY